MTRQKEKVRTNKTRTTRQDAPTDWQIMRETLRAYARPGAPARMPAEDEYEGPSIRMIADLFPGQIVVRGGASPWVWARDLGTGRPQALKEASEIYNQAGGEFPGPVQWFEGILVAKRGHPFRFSPFTTLYVPIDVFANINRQIAESKSYCEAVRRKLIEASGQKPQQRGPGREEGLAENILMVVLRKWKGESISDIAKRSYRSGEEYYRRLTTRRIHKTHLLLKALAEGYAPPAKRTCPRK